MEARRVPTGWLWVVLMGMLVVPFPLPGVATPMERGAPIMYLMVAGALALFGTVARVSWPLALLLLYCLGHTMASGMPIRGMHLVLLLALAALLYVEAARMSTRTVRACGWALLAGGAVQAVTGTMNLFDLYPSPPFVMAAHGQWAPVWMKPLSPDFARRAMGWLTHPNYWGSFMALLVPVAYWIAGPIAGLLSVGLVLLSGSVGPAVTAIVAFAVMAWPRLPRLARVALPPTGASVAVLMLLWHLAPRLDNGMGIHLENLTSGRLNVWLAAWPRVLEAPLFGHGFGSWRLWAAEFNRLFGGHYATLQAHNEPLQLLFELGTVGVALVTAWLVVLLIAAKRALREPVHDARVWVAVLIAALVNSLGSPTFHLPAQAGIALFAAARMQAATLHREPAGA